VTTSTTSIKHLDYNATTNTPLLELSNCNVTSNMPSFGLADYNITFANGLEKCKNYHGTQKCKESKYLEISSSLGLVNFIKSIQIH